MTLDEKIQQQEKELFAALAAMCQEIGSDSRSAMLFAETLLDAVCGRIDTLNSPKLDKQRYKAHFDVIASWVKDSLPLIMAALQYYSRMMGYSELQNERMKINAGGEPFQEGETMLAQLKEKRARWLDTLLPFLQEHGEKIGVFVHTVQEDLSAAMQTAQGNSTVH